MSRLYSINQLALVTHHRDKRGENPSPDLASGTLDSSAAGEEVRTRESTEGRKPITHLEGDGAWSGERLPRSLEDGSRAREGERTGMLHCVTVCMGLPSTEMESERGTSTSKDVRAQF